MSNAGFNSTGVYSVFVQDNTIFAGTGSGGIYKSTDNGDNWVLSSIGTTRLPVNTLTAYNNELYAGTDYTGLFASTDSGNKWISLCNGLADKTVSCVSKSDNIICAGTPDKGLFLSIDNGNSFSRIYTNGADYDNWIHCAEYINGNIIFGSSDGIYFSSDLGKTWTLINNGVLNKGVMSFLNHGNRILTATYKGTIYSSTDDGKTWSEGANIDGTPIYSLTASKNNLFAGTDNGMHLSTNDGATWTSVTSGISVYSSIHAIVAKDNYLCALSDSYLIYISADNGAHWKSYDITARPNIYCLAVLGDYIYTGTSLGIWKRPLSDVVGVTKEVNSIPNDIIVLQNYPNPFNPTTKIKYNVAKSGQIEIKIYNSLLQELSTIVNDYKHAGSYEIGFNAVNLPSGVYFATINQSGKVTTLKMNLVK